MDEPNDRQRITWTTRISVTPGSRDMIRAIAREERMPVAKVVGLAIESYVTARSSA